MNPSKSIRLLSIAFLFYCFSHYCGSPATMTTNQLEKWWKSIEKPQNRFGTRDFFAFALEATAANWHPERVEIALSHASQKQDRNPASRTFGNFAWYWEDKLPEDRNCVEFCMQRGSLLWLLYKDRLTPHAKQLLSEIIGYSVEGIKRHRVPPSYSNIYLKKTWNCIAIGENTDRPELAKEGYSMLQTWLLFTRSNGVSEYLSPTYYAIDMENIGLIARYSKEKIIREKAKLAMDYFWAQVAANWFTPADRLGGAHSRDYDYLFGRGGLDNWVIKAGWSIRAAPAPTFFADACWIAPQERLQPEILETTPRMVWQRWGSQKWNNASQWLGKRIAIGTAGAAYPDAMDKTFVVLFEGANRPTCSFLMDARLDPYGKKRYITGGGHLKAHHVYPFLATVQNTTDALLIASAKAGTQAFQRSGTNLTCWLSHWVIPSDIPLYIGAQGKEIIVQNRFRLDSIDTPIFLKDKDAIAGFKFIYATSPQQKTPYVEIVDDGAEWNARRITCVHSDTPPAGRATVATLVRVAEQIDENSFQNFRKEFASIKPVIVYAGDKLDIAVAGKTSRLRLYVDLEKEQRLSIEGATAVAKDSLLIVNGKELGLPILERAIALPLPE